MASRWPGAPGSPERRAAYAEDREARRERAEERGQSQSVARGHPRQGELPARDVGRIERTGAVSVKDLPGGLAAVWTKDAQGKSHKTIVTRAEAQRILGDARDKDVEVTSSP